jgi:iron-sulfur cluster repair protein YtfE (RIC family)
MAQRHPSLIALSHDHHHGLALALRLRQGQRALLTDGWTHDRREQARRTADFFDDELAPHFAAEERALFPVLRAGVPVASPLIDRLIGEHRAMEQARASLAYPPEDPGELLTRFGELLERHIRAEERELFPLFERHCAAIDAAAVGKAIDDVVREVKARTRG